MLGLFISYRVKKLTDSREIPTMTMPTTVPDFPVAMVK
jgi:hypothetical protein